MDAIAPEQMPELIGQIQKSAASESESLNGIFQISLTGFGMFDANAIKKARKQSGESRNDLRIQIWKMDPATDLQALKNEWLDRANRSPKSTMMFWLQSFVALIFALGLMGAIYKGYKGYKAYSAYNCRGE